MVPLLLLSNIVDGSIHPFWSYCRMVPLSSFSQYWLVVDGSSHPFWSILQDGSTAFLSNIVDGSSHPFFSILPDGSTVSF
jgi:hypothetical protein